MELLKKILSFIYNNFFPFILEHKLTFFLCWLYVCFILYRDRHLTLSNRFKSVLKSLLLLFLFRIVIILGKMV